MQNVLGTLEQFDVMVGKKYCYWATKIMLRFNSDLLFLSAFSFWAKILFRVIKSKSDWYIFFQIQKMQIHVK
jgi:hypothetical protein